MRRASIAGIVLLSCTYGCGDDPESKPDPVGGKRFESVDLVGMGLGPDGPVEGRATLSFDGGQYEWRISDLNCHGSYTVDGDTIVAQTRVPCESYGNPIRAQLAEDSTLTWAGMAYRPAD